MVLCVLAWKEISKGRWFTQEYYNSRLDNGRGRWEGRKQKEIHIPKHQFVCEAKRNSDFYNGISCECAKSEKNNLLMCGGWWAQKVTGGVDDECCRSNI